MASPTLKPANTTHFGDVHAAWEKLRKDDSHGNYFVAKYEADGDKVRLCTAKNKVFA